MAHEADVDLDLADFQRISTKVPHLADVKPFGRYVMTDIDRVGGVPVVMQELDEAGLLHRDCLTVTGKTVAENLEALSPREPDGKITRSPRRCGARGHRDPARVPRRRRVRW